MQLCYDELLTGPDDKVHGHAIAELPLKDDMFYGSGPSGRRKGPHKHARRAYSMVGGKLCPPRLYTFTTCASPAHPLTCSLLPRVTGEPKYVQAPVTLATLTEGPMGYLAEIVGSLPTIIGGLYKDGWEPPKVHAFFECMRKWCYPCCYLSLAVKLFKGYPGHPFYGQPRACAFIDEINYDPQAMASGGGGGGMIVPSAQPTSPPPAILPSCPCIATLS